MNMILNSPKITFGGNENLATLPHMREAVGYSHPLYLPAWWQKKTAYNGTLHLKRLNKLKLVSQISFALGMFLYIQGKCEPSEIVPLQQVTIWPTPAKTCKLKTGTLWTFMYKGRETFHAQKLMLINFHPTTDWETFVNSHILNLNHF